MSTKDNYEESLPLRINLRLGPHNLGDPDDKRLRKVEKNVLIKNMIREEAKNRCRDLIDKFVLCAKDAGLLLPFQCRVENNAQIECLRRWFFDKDLNEKMTEEYLKERSEYRRTGIPVKNRLRRI